MKILNKIRKDKEYRDNLVLIASLLFTIFFIIYNIIGGIIYYSLWNFCIGIYYILLLLIKGIIYFHQRKRDVKKDSLVFNITSSLLFILNLALITPIILMILNKRIIIMSLIFSIGIATYTTYKVTMAIINYIKSKKTSDIIKREIRTINIIDAIVSILTLQNTLITVNGGEIDQGLFIVTIISSGLGLIAILYFIVDMIIFKKNLQFNKN